MNMKKLFLMVVAVVAFAATADAQGFLKKLKDRAVDRVRLRTRLSARLTR